MTAEYYSSLMEWHTHQNIALGVTLIVPLGNDQSGVEVLDGRLITYLNFFSKADVIMNIELQADDDPAFGTADVLFSVNIPAVTVGTIYSLPAPLNQTGTYRPPSVYLRWAIGPTGPGTTNNIFHARGWRE